MIETELRTYITGHADTAAVFVSRIYPETLPINTTLPAIAYNRINTMHSTTLAGSDNYIIASIQFTVIDTTYILTRTNADLLIGILNGFYGTLTTTRVLGCKVIADNNLGYENENDSTKKRYGIAIDVDIHYNEA